jgi:glycosyltransferase involved in cell wall biosynthesis
MVINEADGRSYALVTAAYNEENYISRALQSITAQTVRPKKWVIVNDGSNDRTEEIVRQYAEQYKFIELCKIVEEHPRNLTAQVNAINKGFSHLIGGDYDFIGNLDADVSFGPTYFENLLERFSRDPKLGLAGGFIYEEEKAGYFKSRRTNNIASVAHAVQLFRRECLEDLGGYKSFSWAGADWHAEVSLRMKGWHVRSFPELQVDHHRPTGRGFGLLRYWYRGGVMDFYMGTHPFFELFRMARRCREKPYFLGALVRLVAFGWAYCRGEKRQVSDEFVGFLRKEQMGRLRLYCPWPSAVRKRSVCPDR